MFHTTSEINRKVEQEAFSGITTLHGISKPVLYKTGIGFFCLAYFIFFFTEEDRQAEAIDRPTEWLLADMETGDIIEKHSTAQKEFSDANYHCKYEIIPEKKLKVPTKEFEGETDALFDKIRQEILQKGTLDVKKYKKYMQRIIQGTSFSYRRFYWDLSVRI